MTLLPLLVPLGLVLSVAGVGGITAWSITMVGPHLGSPGSAVARVGRGEAGSQCLCRDQDCQDPRYHYCRQ